MSTPRSEYHSYRCNECRKRAKKCALHGHIFDSCQYCKRMGKPCVNLWFIKPQQTLRAPKTRMSKVDAYTFNLNPSPCAILVYQRDFVNGKYRHLWCVFKKNDAAKLWCTEKVDFCTICKLKGTTVHDWISSLYQFSHGGSFFAEGEVLSLEKKWVKSIVSAKRINISEKFEYVGIGWTRADIPTISTRNAKQDSDNFLQQLNSSFNQVEAPPVAPTPQIEAPARVIPSVSALEKLQKALHTAMAPNGFQTYVNIETLLSVNNAFRILFTALGKRDSQVIEIQNFASQYLSAPDTCGCVYDLMLPYEECNVYTTKTHRNIFLAGTHPAMIRMKTSNFQFILNILLSKCMRGQDMTLPKVEVFYADKRLMVSNLFLSTSQWHEKHCCLVTKCDNVTLDGASLFM